MRLVALAALVLLVLPIAIAQYEDPPVVKELNAAFAERQRHKEAVAKQARLEQFILGAGTLVAFILCSVAASNKNTMPNILQGRIWLTAFLGCLMLYWLIVGVVYALKDVPEPITLAGAVSGSTYMLGCSLIGRGAYQVARWLAQRFPGSQ